MNVVNIKTEEDWDVYIGRTPLGEVATNITQDGYFGSPIKLNKRCPICGKKHKKPGETLPCFELYAKKRMLVDEVYYLAIKGLYGQILGCFCKPSPCHGDVLVKLTNEIHMFGKENDTTPNKS